MDTAVLTAISKLVLTIPDKEWDMSLWWSPCDSVGCAIGHAVQKGLIPGLELKPPLWLSGNLALRRQEASAQEYEFTAIALALGISTSDAEWLFASGDYEVEFVDWSLDASEDFLPTQAQVSSRIAAYVLVGGRP